MQRIALAKASPGMILARSICLPDGIILLGEGQELSEAVIGRVKAAGIGTIWVEGNPLGPGGDVGNLGNVAKMLPYLFRWHEDNVFMMTLRNVFSRHFAKRIAEQRALEDAAITRTSQKAAGDSGADA